MNNLARTTLRSSLLLAVETLEDRSLLNAASLLPHLPLGGMLTPAAVPASMTQLTSFSLTSDTGLQGEVAASLGLDPGQSLARNAYVALGHLSGLASTIQASPDFDVNLGSSVNLQFQVEADTGGTTEAINLDAGLYVGLGPGSYLNPNGGIQINLSGLDLLGLGVTWDFAAGGQGDALHWNSGLTAAAGVADVKVRIQVDPASFLYDFRDELAFSTFETPATEEALDATPNSLHSFHLLSLLQTLLLTGIGGVEDATPGVAENHAVAVLNGTSESPGASDQPITAGVSDTAQEASDLSPQPAGLLTQLLPYGLEEAWDRLSEFYFDEASWMDITAWLAAVAAAVGAYEIKRRHGKRSKNGRARLLEDQVPTTLWFPSLYECSPQGVP